MLFSYVGLLFVVAFGWLTAEWYCCRCLLVYGDCCLFSCFIVIVDGLVPCGLFWVCLICGFILAYCLLLCCCVMCLVTAGCCCWLGFCLFTGGLELVLSVGLIIVILVFDV